jgi:hypothetical protein
MIDVGLTGIATEDGQLAGAPGSSMALTLEGWEVSDYVEPADDWVTEDDGSLSSPDGSVRTWLLSADAG